MLIWRKQGYHAQFKAVLLIDDRRGNPSPRMPLVWSFSVTLESVMSPKVR